MGRYADRHCPLCGSNKKMVYDAVISTRDRKNPEKEVKVYWCMHCEVIIRFNEQLVHDKVVSVRATIFKNKQSKNS